MKQFLVFMGFDYYPNPAWQDFFGDFDKITDAEDAAWKEVIRQGRLGWADKRQFDWVQIVDTREERSKQITLFNIEFKANGEVLAAKDNEDFKEHGPTFIIGRTK